MNILIVSATKSEIDKISNLKLDHVDYLITGIGIANTVFRISETLSSKSYELVINIGIAGTFSDKINIGDVVNVKKETFGDLGFEDKEVFIPISESKVAKNQKNNFVNPNTFDFLNEFNEVESITVNTSSGQLQTIKQRKQLFNADIENMEGAAVFYVCLEKNVPFIELRSISNYIEERNISNWNIPLAVKNLNEKVLDIINIVNPKSNA